MFVSIFFPLHAVSFLSKIYIRNPYFSFIPYTDNTEDYHDLVSIIVDADTYGSLKSEIKQYSTDIQSYLGSTRVSLFVVPKNTPPEAIAAENEKLYYNGDGKK